MFPLVLSTYKIYKYPEEYLYYVFFPTAVPDPPENLKWRDKSGKSIFLSWELPKYDGGAHIKGYVVDKCQRGTDKWEPCDDPIPELK